VPLRCTLVAATGERPWRPPSVALHRCLAGDERATMARHMSELYRWWQGEGSVPWARLRQDGLLAAMLLALVDGPRGPGLAVARDPFEGLRGQLLTHPHQRPSVAEMARRVGLSQKHFIRAFRQRYGETPRACQIRLRCERAAYLLAETADERFRVRAAGIRLVRQGGRFGLVTEGSRAATEVPADASAMVAWVLERKQFSRSELASAFPDRQAAQHDQLLKDLGAMRLTEPIL